MVVFVLAHGYFKFVLKVKYVAGSVSLKLKPLAISYHTCRCKRFVVSAIKVCSRNWWRLDCCCLTKLFRFKEKISFIALSIAYIALFQAKMKLDDLHHINPGPPTTYDDVAIPFKSFEEAKKDFMPTFNLYFWSSFLLFAVTSYWVSPFFLALFGCLGEIQSSGRGLKVRFFFRNGQLPFTSDELTLIFRRFS